MKKLIFSIAFCCLSFADCYSIDSKNSTGMEICRETKVCSYISPKNDKQFRKALAYWDSKKGASSIKSIRKDIDLLWRALNYSKMWIVGGNSDYSLWDRLNVPVDGNYNGTIWKTLAPVVHEIMDKYEVSLDIAERAALLTAYPLPWDSAKEALTQLYGTGSVLGHQYTLEEALFVLDLCPQLKKIWFFDISPSKEDCRFFSKCLIGSMVVVLKARRMIDQSFSLDLAPYSMTEDEFISHNAIRLLREMKSKTGWTQWLVDDEKLE